MTTKTFDFMQTKPKAILFDWDGTLVDSLDFVRTAHNTVRTKFGLEPFSPEEAKRQLVRAAAEVFPEIYGANWKEAYDYLYALYSEGHLEGIKAYTGTSEILDFLASAGIKQGVVSNKRNIFLKPEVSHLKFEHHFAGCVVGAGDAPKAKPAGDPILLGLSLHNIPPQDAWYVGDAKTDVFAAHAAGCKAIYLDESLPNDAELQPDAHFANIQSFLEHLRHLDY